MGVDEAGVEMDGKFGLLENCGESKLKHSCRICKRRFACGRALGGHMRVHGSESGGVRSSSHEEKKVKALGNIAENEDEDLGGSIYGLRRNPKRNLRFLDQDCDLYGDGSSDLRIPNACTECGKDFSSWNALFEHMRCHSLAETPWRSPPFSFQERNSNGKNGEVEISPAEQPRNKWQVEETGNSRQRNFELWFEDKASENKPSGDKQAIKMDLEKPAETFRYAKDSMQELKKLSCKESFGEDSEMGTTSENKSSFKRRIKGKTLMLSSSPQTKNEEEEDEDMDMANCLMMLAQGDCFKATSSSPEDPETRGDSFYSSASDSANQKISNTGEDSLSEYQSGRANRGKMKDSRNGSVEDFNYCRPKNRTIYKCKTCRKVFHTYQALGGHRASHKKSKALFAEAGAKDRDTKMVDGSLEDEKLSRDEQHVSPDILKQSINFQTRNEEKDQISESLKSLRKQSKIHECSVCHRVFSSGQALGGHKRSHLSLAADVSSPFTESPQRHLLDLNIPASATDCNLTDPSAHDKCVDSLMGTDTFTDKHTLTPPDTKPWWVSNNQNSKSVKYKTHNPQSLKEDEAESKLGSPNTAGNSVQDLIQSRGALSWLKVSASSL